MLGWSMTCGKWGFASRNCSWHKMMFLPCCFYVFYLSSCNIVKSFIMNKCQESWAKFILPMHFYEDPNGSLGTKHNAALTMRSWLTFRNNPHQLQLVHHPTKEKNTKIEKYTFSPQINELKKYIWYNRVYIYIFLQHVFVALETKKHISQATPITTQRNKLCTSGWSNFFSDSKDSASDKGKLWPHGYPWKMAYLPTWILGFNGKCR